MGIGFSEMSSRRARSCMKKETRRWIRKAEADLEGATELQVVAPHLCDLICFHCQQAAEKYLKAYLQEQGLPVPRSHDLEKLLTQVIRAIPSDKTLKRLRRTCVFLGKFAVDFRYPDYNASTRNVRS